MKYLMTWNYRLTGSATENEQSIQRSLAVFSKWTPPQSTKFLEFLARVDGTGGCAVIETEDPADIAESVAKFAFFVEYQVMPMLEMDESARLMHEGIEFRQAIA